MKTIIILLIASLFIFSGCTDQEQKPKPKPPTVKDHPYVDSTQLYKPVQP